MSTFIIAFHFLSHLFRPVWRFAAAPTPNQRSLGSFIPQPDCLECEKSARVIAYLACAPDTDGVFRWEPACLLFESEMRAEARERADLFSGDFVCVCVCVCESVFVCFAPLCENASHPESKVCCHGGLCSVSRWLKPCNRTVAPLSCISCFT